MKHKFKYICYDAKALLEDVDTLSKWMNRVNKQSEEDHGKGWTSKDYKGMAFESLVEVLINCSPVDKRINIIEYRPHSAKLHGPDVGIDGYGKNMQDKPARAQCKFVNNILRDLTTQDSISNFVANALSNPTTTDADLIIFTTAKDLNQWLNEKMYHNRVRTFGYNELKQLIDGNSAFWQAYRTQMGIK